MHVHPDWWSPISAKLEMVVLSGDQTVLPGNLLEKGYDKGEGALATLQTPFQ